MQIISKDQITYERKTGHCSKSNYVKEVTIKEVIAMPNADSLEIVKFDEAGWQVVMKKGTASAGDKVFFMPPETVLPKELSDALGVTKYLQRGKVKVVKLRGEFSEGLIADKDVCQPYLDYILQWEDEPTPAMSGDTVSSREESEIESEFPKFYKIPNLLNEPDIFAQGDEVYITEKIHGTNCRFGILKNPRTKRYELYVGSHKVVLKNPAKKLTLWEKFCLWIRRKKAPRPKKNLYWSTVTKTLRDKNIPKDVVFYGEIYGAGVQDLDYGVDAKDLGLRIFATYENGKYNAPGVTYKICEDCGLETVPHTRGIFNSIDEAVALSEQPSELTTKHIREGIVLQSPTEPRRWAKVVSPEYLMRKGKTSERH